MRKIRIAVLLALSVCFVFAGAGQSLIARSALNANASSSTLKPRGALEPRYEGDAPTVVEFNASPSNDPDPRNETALAVSPLNDQIIAGCSKLIVGGAAG